MKIENGDLVCGCYYELKTSSQQSEYLITHQERQGSNLYFEWLVYDKGRWREFDWQGPSDHEFLTASIGTEFVYHDAWPWLWPPGCNSKDCTLGVPRIPITPGRQTADKKASKLHRAWDVHVASTNQMRTVSTSLSSAVASAPWVMPAKGYGDVMVKDVIVGKVYSHATEIVNNYWIEKTLVKPNGSLTIEWWKWSNAWKNNSRNSFVIPEFLQGINFAKYQVRDDFPPWVVTKAGSFPPGYSATINKTVLMPHGPSFVPFVPKTSGNPTPMIVTSVSMDSKKTDPIITLKGSHAKPQNINRDCCGWCGEVLGMIYEPGRGTRRGCSVHGFDCPVIPGLTKG